MKGQFIAKLRSAKKTPKVTSVSEKIHILQGNGFVWKDLQNPDRSKLEDAAKRAWSKRPKRRGLLTKFELPKLDSYDITYFSYCIFPRLDQKDLQTQPTFRIWVKIFSLLHVEVLIPCKRRSDGANKGQWIYRAMLK